MAGEQQRGSEGEAEGGSSLALVPGVPIRGIRMKFAVLSGLLEVGEVSNRDLLETVFNLTLPRKHLPDSFSLQDVTSILCIIVKGSTFLDAYETNALLVPFLITPVISNY